MAGLVVYLLIFGCFAGWASRDAKQRIAAGEGKRDVGGGPVSVFLVLLLMPIWGGLLYLYKRQKSSGASRRSSVPGATKSRVPALQASGPSLKNAVTGPVTLPSTPVSRCIYCSWCGASRNNNSHALHYCGSRGRPPTFCSACGSALAGAATCQSRGTPGHQLSPR